MDERRNNQRPTRRRAQNTNQRASQPTPRSSARQTTARTGAGQHASRSGAGQPSARSNARTTIDGRPSAQRSQTASQTGQSAQRSQMPENTPSWYDPQTARGSRTPRATLDTSMRNSRWYSSGTSDVYVGNRRRRRRNPAPFIVAGVVALLLIAGIAFGVSSCSNNAEPAAETTDENTAVSDTAVETTSLTISFAGNCTLGTDENFNQSTSFNAMYDSVSDPSYFFANVADIFNADDLTVVNMEGTLTTSTTREDKTYAFKGPAEYANVLVQGGVEAASLANNHSHDYGEVSYTDTITALDEAGIDSFGYDRIAYEEVNGVKVALIGTYELAVGIDIQEELVANIQAAEEAGAQLTIVYFHWGSEKETVSDETQVQLGHIAVDAGADLVIGSHPHVIQGYEKYNGRYIVYSLGNFCFGGNSNPSDKDRMIFQQTFTVTGSDVATDDAINVIPCSISSTSSSNNYQPTPASGDEKTRIEAKIEESNAAIATLSASLQS